MLGTESIAGASRDEEAVSREYADLNREHDLPGRRQERELADASDDGRETEARLDRQTG